MMPRKKSKTPSRISKNEEREIVCELERWAAGERDASLTWAALSRFAGFSRQSLSDHPNILKAFQSAKEALRSGKKRSSVGQRTRERLEVRFAELQAEIQKYRDLEARWMERWIRIAYHAQSKGMSIDDLDKPFTIPQEEELADAKRPDLRFHGVGFDAPVPLELKLADKWTGPHLFERLEMQLVRDYLRDRRSSRGIFGLIYLGTKSSWELPNGKRAESFDDLIEALQNYWTILAPQCPRVEDISVIGIDLTKRGLAAKKASREKGTQKAERARARVSPPKAMRKVDTSIRADAK